jgi:hypothetical protein
MANDARDIGAEEIASWYTTRAHAALHPVDKRVFKKG